MSELKLLENGIHVGEWIQRGRPKSQWFYIVRNERLSAITSETPAFLAKLILRALEGYGDFETRQFYLMLKEGLQYYEFEYSGHEFITIARKGWVNAKEIPVMSVLINAKIVRRKNK